MIQPVFSVIIPHRDCHDLLIRALKSIPVDNSIEILVVDNSIVPLDEKFLTIVNNHNCVLLHSDLKLGAGHARNVGLKYAKGKWLLFLDSDDFFTSNAFDSFSAFADSDYDVVFWGMEGRMSNSLEKITNRGSLYSTLIEHYMSRDCEDYVDRLKFGFLSPCAKMVCNKIVQNNSISFDEVPYNNDDMFAVKLAYFSHRITALNSVVYCATVRDNSISTTMTRQAIECKFLEVMKLNSFLRSIGKGRYQVSVMRYLYLMAVTDFWGMFKLLYFAFKYHNNIFIGYNNWISTITGRKIHG